MRIDLWEWFNRFATHAYLENNSDKQRIVQLYDLGWEALRAEKHQQALDYFENGLQLARTLRLPCFELFFDYWCAETLVFYQNDYRTGLDRAIKMGARAHQDQYLECPVRGRAYYTLMYVYYAMDAIGYEDKIREMIDYMLAEIPLDDDTYQRMMYTKSSLAFTLDDYEQSRQIIESYIALTIGNAHRQSGGYNMLRMNAFANGDVEQAIALAHTGELYARVARLENSVALSLLWQALYAHYLDEPERAHTLYRQGQDHYTRFDLQPLPEYYDAVCQYLEKRGDIEQALSMRQQQIATITDVGSVSYTAYSHLAYVRLLGRSGQDITDALAQAHQASQALLKPQHFLDKLKKVESGNYYQYDWQKNR